MRSLRLLGVGVLLGLGLAALLCSAWRKPSAPAPAERIFLIGTRPDTGQPLADLADLALVAELLAQRYSARLALLPGPPPLQRDHAAVFREFEQTRDLNEALPIFVALGGSDADTRKRLRAAVDTHLLPAAGRRKLLGRLVVVRDSSGLGEPAACRQLDDDIRYAIDVFRGIGLQLAEHTLPELRRCIEGLQRAGLGR